MTRELEPWGGEVRIPSWLRRLLRRPLDTGDSPERAAERVHERLNPGEPTVTVFENCDRALLGGFTELRPQRPPARRAR